MTKGMVIDDSKDAFPGTSSDTHPAGTATRVPSMIRAVLTAAAAPMAVIDAEGICLTANRAYVGRAGGELESLIGRPLVPPTRASVARIPLESGPEGGTPELRLVTLTTAEPTEPSPPAIAPVVAPPVDDDLLARALDVLPVVFNLKDTEHRYLFVNRFQAAVQGIRAADAIGRDVVEVCGVPVGEYLRAVGDEIITSGRPSGFFEERAADHAGVMRDWLMYQSPVRRADGAIEALATVALDVTERVDREEELVRDRDRAEEEGRARGRFLATVGHELRSPLNAIVGFAEVLASERFGPLGHDAYRDHVGDILSAGRHLLEVVEDIVDLARFEAGRLRLNEEPEDLSRLIHDSLRMMGFPAQRKGIAIERLISIDPPPVVVDARRVRQVLVNLVSNALKYTPDGGHVAIELGRDPAGGPGGPPRGGDVWIEVRDDGVGIAPENLALAMSPFGRVVREGAAEQEGCGLGLPLVKALMEAHGGRFELSSEPGRGTRARCVLPAHRVRPRTDD